MPWTRSRLASKNDSSFICCNHGGENWIMCESCQHWVHSGCVVYSKDDYKFLERSKNVIFLCDGCIPAVKKNMCEKSTSLSEELIELKTSVEEVKAAIG